MSKQAGRFSADGQDQHVAPLAVTGLTATNVGTGSAYNNGAANLAWSLPSNSIPATLYTITSTPTTTTQTTSSTSYQFTGLASNTAYTFTVVPSNSYGSGPSTTSGSITATTAPQAPSISSVTNVAGRPYGSPQVSVAFTANGTGGSSITSYNISSSSGVATVTGVTTSPYTFQETTPGTYTYTVYAINANGTSAGSTGVSGTSSTIPSAPASASASVVNSTTVTITYGAINTGNSPLVALVGSGTDTGDITDSTGSAVNLTYSGTLNPAGGTINVTGTFPVNTGYTFNIRAVNANGASAYATTAAVTPYFSFAPFGFTPFAFTPVFGFVPVFGFTPFGFVPVFGFNPYVACIHEDTLISTPNGYVKAKDLQMGDEVLSIDLNEIPNNGPDGEVQYDYTTWTSDTLTSTDGIQNTKIVGITPLVKTATLYFNGEEEKKFSFEQPIFCKKDGIYQILQAALIDEGDHLINVDAQGNMTEIEVKTITGVEGGQNVYLFDMEPQDWYFAGDYLVHNK